MRIHPRPNKHARVESQTSDLCQRLERGNGDDAAVADHGQPLDRRNPDAQPGKGSRAGGSITFVGDGAVKYGDLLRSRTPGSSRVTALPLLAGAIGRMAIGRARRGEAVDPAGLHPLYVRRPDAEIEREKKTSTATSTTGIKEKLIP